MSISNSSTAYPKEAVGRRFDLDAMRYASAQSWRAVERMVDAFKPGLRESDANALCIDVLVGLEVVHDATQPHAHAAIVPHSSDFGAV